MLMAMVYGNFEAVRELYKSAAGSVWSARSKSTSEAPTACVKLIQLDRNALADRDTSDAESLLVSAAIQQTMANKSEFWAPVYELGSDGSNAFFISRLYPRSLQSLIESDVTLSSTELKTIMLAIVDGLIDLETAYRRQHGNLKPTNVMLAAKGHVAPGGVLLADPDPTAEVIASMTRAPDTKAMAQILYSLVTHRPYSGARLPLPNSPAWKQLGSTGKEWFTLCQRMLDTFSRQGLPTLESIRLRIGEIQPTRRRMPRTVYAVLFLAAAAAVGYQQRSHVIRGWDRGRVAVSSGWDKYVRRTPAAYVKNPATVTLYPHSKPTTQTTPHAVSPNVSRPELPSPTPTPTPTPAPTAKPAAAPAVVTTTAPSARPVVPAPTPQENPVTARIKTTASPAMHSPPAEQEFLRRRDQFLAAQPAGGSVNLVDWNNIYRAAQALDARYPKPEPTSNWPAGLAAQANARRDAELTKAVSAIFDHDNADPSAYTTELSDIEQTAAASGGAREAVAGSDPTAADAAVKNFRLRLDALESVDADASATFAPVRDSFAPFVDARTATDRGQLLIGVANENLPLSTRLRSWFRLSKAGGAAWPPDLATLAADRAQGDHLAELTRDNPAMQADITAEQQARFDGFFASIRDADAARAAARQAATAQLTALVPMFPDWFQYDVMLARMQATPPAEQSREQVAALLELADKHHVDDAARLHAAFTAVAQPAKNLATAGPVAAGWTLAPGSNADHRTYTSAGQSIEFLRVHQPGSDATPGVDCYLSTTETPVSLLQSLFDKKHAARRQAVVSLNPPPAGDESTMKVWSVGVNGIDLDVKDYKACFLLAPTAHLPAQSLSPEAALYVSRLLGCRLPTSDEWHAALAQVTQPTADPYQFGFATRRWKLRDSDYTAAMNRAANSPAPQYWPGDRIFRDPNQPAARQHAADTRTWSDSALASLAGRIAPVPNTNPLDGDQSLPMAAGHMGFREVDDGAHYTGVFHNLIGNVSEWVLDVQPAVSEKLDVSNPDQAAEAVRQWFTPDRQGCVSVIGGSALSTPDLDPRTAYRLPPDAPARAFSDVGFRLAFSDPHAVVAVDPAKLRVAALDHAQYLTSASAKRPAE